MSRRRPVGPAPRSALALVLALPLAATACTLPIPVPGEWPAGDAPPAGDGACPATRGQQVLDRVNHERARRGLPAMTAHTALARAAVDHSIDQARQGRLSHTGSDGSSVGDRVRREGYQWSRVGENVGGGYGTAAEVVAGWMNSPGHRAVILTPGQHQTGVGYAAGAAPLRHYWTLVVAQPAGEAEGPGLACHP